MHKQERRRKLLKLLSRERCIETKELPRLLNTSSASALRDVVWLVQHDLATRSRGMVAARDYVLPTDTASRGMFGWTLQQQALQKRAIASAAAEMCQDGDQITISGGATTLLMAQFLEATRMRVLTNSFLIAKTLLSDGANEVLLQGGVIDRAQDLIHSAFRQDLSTYHDPQKTFIGMYGLNESGLIETSHSMIQSEQRFIEQAGQLIVLADSSKFQNTSGMLMCPLSKVSMLITDDGAPPEVVQMLQRHGVRVLQVAVAADALDAAKAH